MKIEDIYNLSRYHSKAELSFLREIVSTVPDKTKAIVNIGVFYGASCAALLLGMQRYNITGPLFCIDVFKYHNAGKPKFKPFRERKGIPWSECFLEQAKTNIAPFVGDKCVHYAQCFSDDFDLSQVEGISLVFIDADHTVHGCLLDILKFSQKVVPGGLILFHDFRRFRTVKRAVEIFVGVRPDFKVISVHGEIGVVQKEAGVEPG